MESWSVRLAGEADLEFLVDCAKRLAFDTEKKVLEHDVVSKGV